MGKPEGPRKDRKNLSWIYRNKKKQGKISKPQNVVDDNVQVQNRKARIIVRNLSFKVTEDDVRNLYAPFGQIEQIDLLKRPDGMPVGCGFIQFKRIEDASKAIFNTNKQDFLGRKINSSWAIPKAKFVEQLEKKNVESHEGDKEKEKVEDDENGDQERPDTNSKKVNITTVDGKKRRTERKKLTAEERKALKLKKRQKRARIVVRNLSFKASEKTLKEHFGQYGVIENIEILKKADGKRVGCAFVQFTEVQSAAKAVHYANMKPICERPAVVDWAVPKTKFVSNNGNADVKEEPEDIKPDIDDDVQILNDSQTEDEMKIDKSDDENEGIKEENGESDSDKSEMDSSDNSEDDEDENGDKTEEEEDDDDDDDNEDVKNEPINEEEPEQRPRVISHDVNEGKTVFLKNVPFSANNDDLRECMQQFGPVYYALVCVDSLTEHSKGTAFVKFRNVEDAEKCLSAGTELRLHDQVLDPHRALDKQDVPDGKNIKTRVKDSRNLYLVKEGVILAGSPAAAGLSASDMAKRLQMEQWKSQMLRNLNMFVSRNRLVVHNLPPTLDDMTLRTIFKNHAGPKAVIQEARVMRDLRNPDANNVGKSKEFGFVAFTTHEDALKALRSINNNPNIFSATKRPIVAFSIENRVMVNAKKRRVEKSREHNPLWKDKRRDNSNRDKSSEPPTKRPMGGRPRKSVEPVSRIVNSEDVEEFAGVTSKPGATTKLRSKFKLKTQAMIHNKALKDEKKQKKIVQTLRAKKADQRLSRNEAKPKQGAKKLSRDDSNLNKLVESYRSKLSSTIPTKSKWYDT